MTTVKAGSVPHDIEDYRSRVHDWVDRLVSKFTSRLETRKPGSYRSKEFNDPVWGTLYFEGHEVAVLDSPLLQRLRRIKQLGVAHLVYPAAQHTRFEHSLGVTHQIERLIESAVQHPIQVSGLLLEAPPLDKHRSILRMAALCHDVGHGLMSHVAENALRSDLNVIRLQNSYWKHLGLDKQPQLSEVAAYEIVGAPAFERLLAAAEQAAGTVLPAEAGKTIQRLIVGLPSADEFPFLHELLTGPFDADKLDYLPRDARMSGVPVVTDVTRLVQKVRAVTRLTSELPEELQQATGARTAAFTGVATSGASTLDELALARSLMADKIYRHHKVRAIECMVAAVIDQVGPIIEPYSAMLPLRFVDEDFLALSAEAIGLAAGRELNEDEQVAAQIAADLCERIRERRLFARAFAFAQKMPEDPYRTDEAQKRAMEIFIRETAGQAEKRRAFLAKVADNAHVIIETTGECREELADLPGGALIPYLALDPPMGTQGDLAPVTGRAYLIGDDGTLMQAREANADTRGWADAYVSTRHTGHVFCPAEFKTVVYLAAEAAAREQFGVRVPKSMLTYAKQDAAVIEAMRGRLHDAGFYTGPLFELRPPASVLATAHTQPRLGALTQKFSGYSPPVGARNTDGRLEGPVLSPERFKDFVRQFPDDLADAALKVIEATSFINRPRSNNALAEFLCGNPAWHGASLCPIGEPKDGSVVFTYYSGDVAEEFGCQILGLESAVLRDAPIVLLDDFIGLGHSITSILEADLGADPTVELGEVRREPLPERARDALRAHPLAVCVTAALTVGIEQVTDTASRLGLSLELVHAMVRDSAIPTVDDALGGDPDVAVDFVNFVRLLSEELLTEPERADHDDAWRAERLVGYGNRGLLVVTEINTPTATLTPLWKGGTFQGRPWNPIFPRRPKR